MNKYTVTVRNNKQEAIQVDVYDIVDACPVRCPALQHLAKKALFAGRRGHKDQLQDLIDIRASADRAIELYHSRVIAEDANDDNEAKPKGRDQAVKIGDKFLCNHTSTQVVVVEVSSSGTYIKYKKILRGQKEEWSMSTVGFLSQYAQCEL